MRRLTLLFTLGTVTELPAGWRNRARLTCLEEPPFAQEVVAPGSAPGLARLLSSPLTAPSAPTGSEPPFPHTPGRRRRWAPGLAAAEGRAGRAAIAATEGGQGEGREAERQRRPKWLGRAPPGRCGRCCCRCPPAPCRSRPGDRPPPTGKKKIIIQPPPAPRPGGREQRGLGKVAFDRQGWVAARGPGGGGQGVLAKGGEC